MPAPRRRESHGPPWLFFMPFRPLALSWRAQAAIELVVSSSHCGRCLPAPGACMERAAAQAPTLSTAPWASRKVGAPAVSLARAWRNNHVARQPRRPGARSARRTGALGRLAPAWWPMSGQKGRPSHTRCGFFWGWPGVAESCLHQPRARQCVPQPLHHRLPERRVGGVQPRSSARSHLTVAWPDAAPVLSAVDASRPTLKQLFPIHPGLA